MHDEAGTRWYRTGDVGTFDGERVTVTGRADNVIISGGINISLDRVERIVRTVAGFESAIVVPVPDERWGQASVVVAAGGAAGRPDAEAAIRAAVAEALGTPARPRGILAVDEIPLLASGKPDRAGLTARAERTSGGEARREE